MSDSEDKSVPSPKIEDKKEEEMDQESDNDNSRVNGSDSSEDKDNSENITEKTEKQDTVQSKKEDSSESKTEKTEINDNSEEMETDSPKKSTKKTEETKSKKKKEVKKVESEEEDEEDDEDSEPKLGLLEQPVVIESGKREKRKVERLSMTEAYNTPNQPKEVDIPEGVGEKLGDIPRVEFQINKFKAEDLKTLHRVLFGKITAATKVKKNIRLFTGFEFKKDDKEYKKRRDMLLNRNFHMPMLKVVCEVLDLEKKGTKDEVAERVMAFCMAPKSTGKKVPQSKKRKRSETKGKGDKKKTKKDSKSSKKKKSKEKVKGSDDEDDDEEEEEEKSEEEEDEEEEEESEEEEVEEEPEEVKAPKKKKAKKETPAKKPAPAKKETKKKEKPTPQKKKESESEEESEQSSDDEEPLVKKAPSAPTNDELKKLVKKILDGANLEQVTMKTVVKQVYDKFPTFDLSDRKQFIKSTVKQFLS
ncbi:protein DEK [Mytilus galloprovincialis]|uniref:Protein DEK n=1 Tax=Mytilus galloprovincialis TaxID=29158 RepID=A0A8B6DCF7_MYTGA|nr:protein DEK [Mytilus galloprovincialis]